MNKKNYLYPFQKDKRYRAWVKENKKWISLDSELEQVYSIARAYEDYLKKNVGSRCKEYNPVCIKCIAWQALDLLKEVSWQHKHERSLLKKKRK